MDYRLIQEIVTVGKVRVSKKYMLTNLADMFANTMVSPRKEDLFNRFTS